jgi:hypothetical protein
VVWGFTDILVRVQGISSCQVREFLDALGLIAFGKSGSIELQERLNVSERV